jgi:hypothetical protein
VDGRIGGKTWLESTTIREIQTVMLSLKDYEESQARQSRSKVVFADTVLLTLVMWKFTAAKQRASPEILKPVSAPDLSTPLLL